MQTIETIYKQATQHNVARILARTTSNDCRYLHPYDHALDMEGNHEAAAQECLVKYEADSQLPETEMVGGTTREGMAWVIIGGSPRIFSMSEESRRFEKSIDPHEGERTPRC